MYDSTLTKDKDILKNREATILSLKSDMPITFHLSNKEIAVITFLCIFISQLSHDSDTERVLASPRKI